MAPVRNSEPTMTVLSVRCAAVGPRSAAIQSRSASPSLADVGFHLCAPTATRTRDLLLRSSLHGQL
jgi:hypothetical protein